MVNRAGQWQTHLLILHNILCEIFLYNRPDLILISCASFRFTGQQLDSRCDVRKKAAPVAALSGPLHLPQPPQEQVPVRLRRHYRLDWPSGGFSTRRQTPLNEQTHYGRADYAIYTTVCPIIAIRHLIRPLSCYRFPRSCFISRAE